MGSFFSSLVTPPPEEPANENSRVVAVHSTASWTEHFTAAKQNPNQLMVIDFSAKWCGPCRMIAPTFESFSAKFTDSVFLKVDVDEVPALSQQWGVNAMPTFLFLKGGKEIGRIVGAKKNELEKMITMNINN